MTSILPEELHDDIPAGFNIAGHVGTSSAPVLSLTLSLSLSL